VFTIPVCTEHIHGAISCERRAGGLIPWRLPYKMLDLFTPDNTMGQHAKSPAGVRVRFYTDATEFALIMSPHTLERTFDLVLGEEIVASSTVPPGETAATFTLPEPVEEPIEIWLTPVTDVELREIRCLNGSYLWPAPDEDRLRWVTYGSSISQCVHAHSPARTWPACVARSRNLNLTCLGYRANCHLEPMVARLIATLPADIITIKAGINIIGSRSLSIRTLAPALIGFVKIVRDQHPHIPIGVISSIVSPIREKGADPKALDLTRVRAILKDAVDRLVVHGDDNLYYFDGSELISLADADTYLLDGTHPNGDGYEYLGRRIAEMVIDKLLVKVKTVKG